MEPLKDLETITAMDQCEMIAFIEKNAEIDWNDACDIAKNIFTEDITFFERENYKIEVSEDNEDYWITEFFKAHAELPDKIMFYFNN